MSDFKTYTRICVDCGKVLCNVGRSAQRCPECGKKHANAQSLEWDRRRNEELQARRQGLAAERSSLALHAEVRAAEEAGLSYGKYMLQKMQANKKPAGAPTPTSPKGDGFTTPHHPDDITKSEVFTRK